MREILLLAYAYPPENIVGALRPARFSKYLPDYGYRAHVVTAIPQPPGAAPTVHYARDVVKGSDAIGGVLGAGEKVLKKAFYPAEQYITWTPAAVRTAHRVIRQYPITAIISTWPPHSTHMAALHLKRKYGLPWIADFRDPLLGDPANVKTARVLRVDSWLDRNVFAAADAIIANTDTVGEVFKAQHPECAHKLHVLWNGYDPAEDLGPLPIPPRAQKIMAHVGEIYGGRHPGPLLEAVDRLTRRGALDPRSFRLDLLGPIDAATVPDFRIYKDLAARGSLRCEDRALPREEALRATAEADYLLLLDWKGMQVPFKLYNYVRIGRPVLALTVRDSPVARILAGSGVPHRVAQMDDPPERFDAALLDFLQLSSEPVRASDWFQKTFDCSAQSGRLASILDSIL